MRQIELASRIGEALLQIQQTEKALGLCMTSFFSGLSWEDIIAQDAGEQKKTLGMLVHEMKKRVPIRADLNQILSSFVRDRNTFIHNIFAVPGFSLESEEGVTSGLAFVASLNDRAVHIRKLLFAASRIATRNGLQDDTVIGPEVTEDQFYDLLAIGTFFQSDEDLEDPSV